MKKLLVLGAGYAGLSFIKKLPKRVLKELEVTLVSKESYHYTSVLLHEVAAGSRESICYDLRGILPAEVRWIQDEITEVNQKEAVGKKASYAYDYLVLSLGFSSDDFKIPGVGEHAHALVDFKGARELKERIFEQFDRFRNHDDPRALEFVVCGAGFSGVEMVTSLNQELRRLAKNYQIPESKIKLTCVEAMPRILPMFEENLALKAADFMQKGGIRLAVGCKILRVEKNAVVIERMQGEQRIEESIYSALSIWTAGVKGSEVVANSSFFTSGRAKIAVDEYLQPIQQENQDKMKNIYVFGDCAALKDPKTERFYPPTAQIAIKQGEYLADAFAARIFGGSVKRFSYQAQGTICSLGDHHAIGTVGEKQVTGRSAILLKRAVEKKWLVKLYGFLGALK